MTVLKAKPLRLVLLIGVILIIGVALLLVDFVIVPVLAPYERAQIPDSCVQNAARLQANMPADLVYAIPGVGMGTLITSDANAAVVVKSDYSQPSFPSSVYLINRKTGQIVQSLQFDNDVISAALDDGVLYLFNDKLGYFVDESSGARVQNIVETDNYRGLYSSGAAQYLQTSMEVSALHANGSVTSHLRVTFSGVAFGCFIPPPTD